MNHVFLPIGSIITVSDRDLMICAYLKEDFMINNIHYNYACCIYPNGMGEEAVLVKKSDIKRVKFIGFQDSKFLEFKKTMEEKSE